MEDSKLIIRARLEEVPPIGQSTIASLKARIMSFKAYKGVKYTDDFISGLEEELVEMTLIIKPIVLTRELKEITLRVYTNIFGLRLTMNLLEGYVADATDLTVGKADFGIMDVRKEIASGNTEGVCDVLGVVITNITNNMPKLVATGYTADMKTALEATKLSIFTDNGLQVEKLEARSKLVKDNYTAINAFLVKIKGIWDDGKRLFSLTDRESAKFFTNAYILKMLRNDELHTKIMGTVYNNANEVVSNVKVKAKPLLEGKRSKTVNTDHNGKYEIKGLKPTSYIITFTYTDGQIYASSADAITNETVTLDFHPPVPE